MSVSDMFADSLGQYGTEVVTAFLALNEIYQEKDLAKRRLLRAKYNRLFTVNTRQEAIGLMNEFYN